jgi:dihydrofolate reductase
MRISLVVAVSNNGVIGDKSTIPWDIPEDRKYFKSLTMSHPILMGRKTYESIGGPLPGRLNIVITRQRDYDPGRTEGSAPCMVVRSIDEAMESAKAEETDEIFIIGGAQIYKQFLPKADRVYMTQIHHHFKGDTHFPSLGKNWRETNREDRLLDRPYSLSYLVFDRIS